MDDKLVSARSRGKLSTSGVSPKKLARKLTFERIDSYQNINEQAFLLYGAFCSISNPALREAVVRLVIELERSD
jgi:hypothetical protein